MVLPSGIDKGTALEWTLEELGISLHQVVSVGDAENDLPFLRISGCSAAVANALPFVKKQADIQLAQARGAGVRELIDRLIANDLAEVKRSSMSQPDVVALPDGDGRPSALAIGDPAEE
jgi:hydroxymethylpyrimidine pyrophosphatase-like HAD family hydrolase